MARSRTRAEVTSTLRLVVVQALVLSLFATLLVRLYHLQVATGDEYTARAASQSVRDVVVQPARGLIVDNQGRPLVTNRTSWVISVDRGTLERMPDAAQERLLQRAATLSGVPLQRIRKRLLDCGEAGSEAGTCWNGSPYQPVPIAHDVPQRLALRVLEQPEDFPGLLAERQTVRSYPEPHGINLAHVLGYLSPITGEELDRAEADGDRSVHGASVVGRAGLEKQYDGWLRGMPGSASVEVDSMGRVIGEAAETPARPGDTLVTSLDAKIQGVVERELAGAIAQARTVFDKNTGRYFEADAGAVVVLEARTGRVVALASQPTYDPEVWVGGITDKQLERLYSEAAGNPLLGRATQGQFAPGSTWKPFVTAGALANGYAEDTRLACPSSFRVGNRDFRNFESGAYGYLGFPEALEVSCNTFFYQIAYDYWRRYGSDVDDVKAFDPLVETARKFGFGEPTGIDLPGEASGRIADRAWKRAYYESQKDYYCELAEEGGSDFLHRFAREFCIEGYAYRAGDAVNFAIGQGDTLVTPLQLARAYAAISNGGTLYEPRIAKAIVGEDGTVLRQVRPKAAGKVDLPKRAIEYVDDALFGVPVRGTLSGRFAGFPLEEVQVRGKTGSAEVYGKQTTSWVASYDDNYVVVMMVSQGGTGGGTSAEPVRHIWEALYGVTGAEVDRDRAAIPGVVAPAGLPRFQQDGSILPPAPQQPGKQSRKQSREQARKQ